jgi:multidrug resistance efflux pump
VERTQQSYDRYRQASKGGSVSELAVENRRQMLVQARAMLSQAQAELDRKTLELQSQRNNVVAKLKAELEQAQFDLDSTVVRAPADGYPTQIFLRPGMMAVPFPVRPTMVFVNQSKRNVLVSYRQNALQRLKVDSEAEIIFPALPGRVFKGKVVLVMPALAEGELQASGTMIRASRFNEEGLVPVAIEIEDDISRFQLPDGTTAMASVYSEHAHHVAIMRKILLRMKSWEHYLYLDH